MLRLTPILVLPFLTACATGAPSCDDATRTVAVAQLAAGIADQIAAADPDAQPAADAAAVALETATAVQAAVCAPVEG